MILSALASNMNPLAWVVLAIGGIIFLVVMARLGRFIKLWVQTFFSGAPISFPDIVGMSMRRVNPQMIVLNYIRAIQAGVTVTSRRLESHLLAGGNVEKVVSALVMAHNRKVNLDFERAAAMDLGGQDPLAYAQKQPPAASQEAPPPVGPVLIGLCARAQGPLRPPAFIELDGQQVAALTVEELIDPGTEVEIVATGQHVLVRRKRPGVGDPFSEWTGFSQPRD